MPIIKNFDTLATTPQRRHILEIIEAGIGSVLPENLLNNSVKYDSAGKLLTVNDDVYDVSTGRIFVVGGGKAGGRMAEALESIIGADDITDGIVNSKGKPAATRKVRIIKAGHPVPDEAGVNGVREMMALKQRYSIGKNDIVIALISGGGSALMPCPAEGIGLADKQDVTGLLINSGAEIGEINTVRKHLSRVKGGQLGRYFSPASVISLIISDVTGNDLSVIASGLTVPDESTFEDARNILESYHLTEKTPESIIEVLEKGCRGEIEETCETLVNCHNYIIGDSLVALEAMQIKAESMGYTPYIITAEQKGDVSEVARSRAVEITAGKYRGHDILLAGGETTVTPPGDAGKGGRNQHYAAASIQYMADCPGKWVAASTGTDGSDFLPDVAGAIVDNNTPETAREKNIDVVSYLERYDSYTLLEKIGDSLIITGDTGTNVGDVTVYMKEKGV